MTSNKKTQNVFAHSPSLQILWKCAGQRRLVTKTLIQSVNFQHIYNDVLHYVNSKTRRRSPLALILDSHLMLGLVYVYSKTVLIWHQDVEKLYKDAVVHRFFEFEGPTKAKLTRKKEAVLTGAQWQIEIDENLLPDERMLLERDFSIEIPRQATPPVVAQSPDHLPPLPWEVSRPSHGQRITLLPDIEEPLPKFDLIDDRFGEPLPVPAAAKATAMDVDQHEDRTFFRAASEDRTNELLRAPRADRQLGAAADRYIHPSKDRTIDEHRPDELPPLPMPTMETTLFTRDQFSIDALAFMTSSIDTYPIYRSTSDACVLLGADCSSTGDVPLIIIQEPTMLGLDEPAVQMDTLPPFDQQLPTDGPRGLPVDAQVPEVMRASADEKEYFHVSKKKRNAPNALNRKRKYPSLFNDIVQFDYDILQTIEDEDDAILTKYQQEGKPWPTLVGRNGAQRMKDLLKKASAAIESADLSAMMNDIVKIANMLTNPGEPEGLAQARRTGQEIAIRRGQTSGLLPKAGTRSPSSLVPMVQDRVSQLPVSAIDGGLLPTFPSGFDDIPLIAPLTDPLMDVRQPLSPLQTTRRGRLTAPRPVEPSPTWQDKQKQKAIEDLLNAAEGSDGGSFTQFLSQSQANRIQAARLFSVLLVLCGEGRMKTLQKEPYGEIKIFLNEHYNPFKQVVPDVHEAMESDGERF